MKRSTKIAFGCLSVLVVIAGLRQWATRLPVKIERTPEWVSIMQCAENQKCLYQSIMGVLRETGKLPDQDFLVRGSLARDTWTCSACRSGYTLHLENYGNPHAAVITDEQDRHPTTFMWWFRGLHPQVQTMGDGTIQFFKGGKFLTMDGSKK